MLGPTALLQSAAEEAGQHHTLISLLRLRLSTSRLRTHCGWYDRWHAVMGKS